MFCPESNFLDCDYTRLLLLSKAHCQIHYKRPNNSDQERIKALAYNFRLIIIRVPLIKLVFFIEVQPNPIFYKKVKTTAHK